MGIEEKTLSLFTTRMRKLVIKYGELKEENRRLRAALGKSEAENADTRRQLAKAREDYDMLMMAKMLEVTDGDMGNAQKRLAKLIRDVNKCITLLSEKHPDE